MQENSWNERIAEALSYLSYLSDCLFSSLLHRRKLQLMGLAYCKIKIPSLISVVICFLIPLACWQTWLLLKPASYPNLAAIMDNKYCPEKRKPSQGWKVVVSTHCRRSNVSSCEPSSVKAWGDLGPPEQHCQEFADQEATKAHPKQRGSSSPGALPALDLLSWTLSRATSYLLFLWEGSKQRGSCCFTLVVTYWWKCETWVVSLARGGSKSHSGSNAPITRLCGGGRHGGGGGAEIRQPLLLKFSFSAK